jgi:hypothetical protein
LRGDEEDAGGDPESFDAVEGNVLVFEVDEHVGG